MTAWIKAIDPQVLDFWKAVGTVFVAVIAAAIAGLIQYRQWRTAHNAWKTAQNKLKLDLFQQRIEIYDAASIAIGNALEGTLTNEKLHDFWQATHRARWLCGEDVVEYYTTYMYDRVIEHADAVRAAAKEEGKPNLAAAKEALIAWADTEGPDRRRLFAKYIKLSHDVDH